MKHPDIYIATFAEGAIETAKECGFGLELDHPCISSNCDEEQQAATIQAMQEDLVAAGITDGHFLVHGPFTELSPCSMDSKAVDLMWERTRQTLAICRALSAPKLIMHSGYFPPMYQPVWHSKCSVDFWKALAPEIPDGLTICVENVFEETPEAFCQWIQQVDDPRIQVCLDVGHIQAMADTDWPAVRWIETFGSLTKHLHLHNNRGGRKDTHDNVQDGNLDMKALLDTARKHCPDATWTIESRNAQPSAQWLTEYTKENL